MVNKSMWQSCGWFITSEEVKNKSKFFIKLPASSCVRAQVNEQRSKRALSNI